MDFTACCAAVPSPFAKESLIWPSTFFLFILSAIASGPSFLMLVTGDRRKSHGTEAGPATSLLRRLGFISGVLLAVYVAAKSIDTLIWLNLHLAVRRVRALAVLLVQAIRPSDPVRRDRTLRTRAGIPADVSARRHRSRGWLLTGAAMACAGVLLNRFVLTVQTLALPTLAFDEFLKYTPSWQEVASFGGVIAYGVIVYSLVLSVPAAVCDLERRGLPHVSGH